MPLDSSEMETHDSSEAYALKAGAPQRRLHAFQRPLHPLQVGAVVAFCVISFINFSLTLPLIAEPNIFSILVAIEAVLTATNVAVYLWTSLIDTADPALNSDDTSLPLYCDTCQSHVDLSSKHCQVCKKCVIGFDHHCLWLNCCIGSRNYPPFILLLSLSILLFSMHLTVAVIHLIDSYIEPEASAESPLGDMPMAAMRVLLALTAAVTAAALCLTADLLLFHAILHAKGLSTYDYILAAKDAFADDADGGGGGRFAAACRGLTLCDSCTALRRVRSAPPPRRASVSVCRALGTSLAAGRQARARRVDTRRVAPLPQGHGDGAANDGAGAPVAPPSDTAVRMAEAGSDRDPLEVQCEGGVGGSVAVVDELAWEHNIGSPEAAQEATTVALMRERDPEGCTVAGDVAVDALGAA